MHLGVSSRCRNCHREATKDWRDRNRERLNAERRAAYREEHPRAERDCVQCGRPFEGRLDALVCSVECRRARQREQRREQHRKLVAEERHEIGQHSEASLHQVRIAVGEEDLPADEHELDEFRGCLLEASKRWARQCIADPHVDVKAV